MLVVRKIFNFRTRGQFFSNGKQLLQKMKTAKNKRVFSEFVFETTQNVVML